MTILKKLKTLSAAVDKMTAEELVTALDNVTPEQAAQFSLLENSLKKRGVTHYIELDDPDIDSWGIPCEGERDLPAAKVAPQGGSTGEGGEK
jgi:hypothetical protein